jgi:hypothetical protein
VTASTDPTDGLADSCPPTRCASATFHETTP